MVMKNSIQKTGDGSLSCNLVIKVLVYDYPHQKSFSQLAGTFLFYVKLFFHRGVTPLLTQNFNDKLKNFVVTPLEDGRTCHSASLPYMSPSDEGEKVLVYDYPHQKVSTKSVGTFLFLQFKKPFGVYVPKGFCCL